MADPDIIIIGGGTAGLAAGIAAKENGAGRVLVLETDSHPGGVLRQCIHSGFGLHTFKEELTGPEYAARFIHRAAELGVEIKPNTPVLDIKPDKTVIAASRSEGLLTLRARAVIIATGCRERPAGAIGIAGTRPAGIMTAGTAQRYINLDGYMVGKKVVILGSGDIGLIMARRLTLEGAKVECVAELMPYSNGLRRNIVQCLDDYGIPLLLSHTVTRVYGHNRVQAVDISKVDENLRPIPDTERRVDCDTLLLSVGLIPETELAREAGVATGANGGIAVDQFMESGAEGVFACGNVVQVHDLVDYVAEEGAKAGRAAALYARGQKVAKGAYVAVRAGDGISYVVPERIDAADAAENGVELSFRVRRSLKSAVAVVRSGEDTVKSARRPFMLPGEMEKLVLPPGVIRPDCAELTLMATGERL